MIILGIETSCDETGAAVIQGGSRDKPVEVLANVVASSEELHKKTGGIVPEVAAREQLRVIIPVIKEALAKAKIDSGEIGAIAVTVGPGLIGSLLVGVETARTLAWTWQKPIVPVNHLKAHLLANWVKFEKAEQKRTPSLPAVGLVVSGGHTELVLMKNFKTIKFLGGTRDDAAGECLDKCARVLGLGYPGGPMIEKAALKAKTKGMSKVKVTKLPRPMKDEANYDFSFSGLKTALIKAAETTNSVNGLAAELQEASAEVLVTKVIRAVKEFKPKGVITGGGVMANQRLRSLLAQAISQLKKGEIGLENLKLFIPARQWCTDNAAVIAATAFFDFTPLPWQKVKANPSLEIGEG